MNSRDKLSTSFMLSQPDGPERRPSDYFYLGVMTDLVRTMNKAGAAKWLHPDIVSKLALCLTGYYQDVIADAGIWHAFIDQHRRLYEGRTLPFFSTDENYIDYEINPEDVRFLIWYFIAMSDADKRDIYPLDPRIEGLAESCYELLDHRYDDAPIPEHYQMAHELEMNNPEDLESLYGLGSWLFLHCYLMTPAFALSLHNLLSDPELDGDDLEAIGEKLDQAMKEDTIGPLAYHMNEWLHLIVDHRLPSVREKEKTVEELHPYYVKVMDHTDGRNIVFFKTYQEMNDFFIDILGWEKWEKHLSALEKSGWFAIMVHPEKGMLVASDVARSIAAPFNTYYDPEVARSQAFQLLTERGRCPSDLLLETLRQGWLPDARFPQTDDTALVAENSDFIARCYLQMYYRGD